MKRTENTKAKTVTMRIVTKEMTEEETAMKGMTETEIMTNVTEIVTTGKEGVRKERLVKQYVGTTVDLDSLNRTPEARIFSATFPLSKTETC